MSATLTTWGEPHADWLRTYGAAREFLNRWDGGDEHPDYLASIGQVNRLEAMILSEPARSPEAVLAKLYIAAQVSADGASPDADWTQALVEEARVAFSLPVSAAQS